MSEDKGQPLPKFGEWDVNNPASAEGFTVIFNKARDERKGNANPGAVPAPPRNNIGGYKLEDGNDFPRKNIWKYGLERFGDSVSTEFTGIIKDVTL